MKKRSHLRLVPQVDRPLRQLSKAEKLLEAKSWLRSRNRYILDAGSRRPSWGIPGAVKGERK